MCGFVGIVSFNENYQIEQSTLQKMCKMIKHRGPDGEGYFVSEKRDVGLGHVRLSVIDLKNGFQPMFSEDKNFVVSFNGEIYDYKKIRKDLLNKGYKFLTESDTEVILNLYKDKGIQFIDFIRGEFTFALYDIKNENLIIVRDHFGTKPLYYTFQNKVLRFASEIKGIFGDIEVKREFNLRTIVEQLMRADSANRTTFSNINILSPGHMIIVNKNQLVIKKYWDVEFPMINHVNCIKPMEYYAENLGTLLRKSVEKRMVADVEVGCFLSGGIDSSIIASIMKEYSSSKIKTFSIGFEDKYYDESYYSKTVANYLQTDHHCIMLSFKDLAYAFPKALYHCEHLVQQVDGAGKYLLSEYASKYLKVVIVGEGADEITMGYPWFKTAKLLNYWNAERVETLNNIIYDRETARKGLDLTVSSQSSYKSLIKLYGYYPLSFDNIIEMQKFAYSLFNEDILQEVLSFDIRDIYLEDIDYNMLKSRDILQQNSYEFLKKTFHTYILQFLGGKSEMANSVEGRLPFLDYDFFNFAKDVPTKYHLFGLREKNLLRIAFRDKLPKNIINRTKHGYSAPILSNFLGKNSPDYFREFLSESKLKKTGLFDYKTVQNFINISQGLDYRSQKRTLYERAIIFVLSVQLIYDMFIENLPVDGHSVNYT